MGSSTYSQMIKAEAQRLGFLACGISKAEFLEDEAPRLELQGGPVNVRRKLRRQHRLKLALRVFRVTEDRAPLKTRLVRRV